MVNCHVGTDLHTSVARHWRDALRDEASGQAPLTFALRTLLRDLDRLIEQTGDLDRKILELAEEPEAAGLAENLLKLGVPSASTLIYELGDVIHRHAVAPPACSRDGPDSVRPSSRRYTPGRG